MRHAQKFSRSANIEDGKGPSVLLGPERRPQDRGGSVTGGLGCVTPAGPPFLREKTWRQLHRQTEGKIRQRSPGCSLSSTGRGGRAVSRLLGPGTAAPFLEASATHQPPGASQSGPPGAFSERQGPHVRPPRRDYSQGRAASVQKASSSADHTAGQEATSDRPAPGGQFLTAPAGALLQTAVSLQEAVLRHNYAGPASGLSGTGHKHRTSPHGAVPASSAAR